MKMFKIKYVGFDWDEFNLKKLLKHNVSVRDVESCFEQDALILEDIKHSIFEKRYILIGESCNKRPMFIVLTFRKKKIRVISSRFMHKKEKDYYGKLKEKLS